MNQIYTLMPVWRNYDLLKITLPFLISSLSSRNKLIVVVNEFQYDETPILLKEHGVKMICLSENYGPIAVDFAYNFIKDTNGYVANINSDMVFPAGWDEALVQELEIHYPCSSSLLLVETYNTGNPCVIIDNVGGPTKESASKFIENFANNKYVGFPPMINYNHPIMVKSSDFLSLGGYSGFLDLNVRSGYGNDDLFAWKLQELHEGNFKYITTSRSCCLHYISQTMKLLSPEIRSQDGISYFNKLTNEDLWSFRRRFNIHGEYPLTNKK